LDRSPFTDADPAPVNALRGVAALGLALVEDVAAADHLDAGLYWLDRANICTPSAVFQAKLDTLRGLHSGKIGQLMDLLQVRDGHTLAALVFLLKLCGHTPHVAEPKPNVQVLLDRGQKGQRATLQLSVLPALPSGLAPDPRTMAWFSADQKFQVSLETA